jgi:hypothetical protein
MSHARPETAEPGSARWALIGTAALAIVVYWWVHGLAGFSFPVPWGDEGAFLWQAIAVQEHGTLLAPQLHPDRPILWMTPAYPIVMGAAFRITGFSLEWARTLSACFLTGGFIALALTVRSLRAPFAGLLLLCGVFLGRDFVLSGNMARMEALLVASLGVASLLLMRGRRIEALALLGLTPLIHPNALLPAAAAGVYAGVVWVRSRNDWRPTRFGELCLAAAAGAWLAYGVYVGLHWSDFLHDMAFQLDWKEQPGPFDSGFWLRWLEPERLAVGLALGVAWVAGSALKSPSVRLLVIAIPLQLLPLTPEEWYYGILRALIFWFACVCLLDVADRAADRFGANRRARAVVALLLLALAGLGGRFANRIESPFGYPYAMRIADMAITPEPAYIDDGDRAAVRAFLARVAANAATAGAPAPTVLFVPWVDALFFHDLDGQGLRLAHPTLRTVQPDLAILHLTRLIPASHIFYARQNLIAATRGLPTLRVRDETEEWRVNRRPRPAAHGARESRRPPR